MTGLVPGNEGRIGKGHVRERQRGVEGVFGNVEWRTCSGTETWSGRVCSGMWSGAEALWSRSFDGKPDFILLALEKWRQEDLEFTVNLGYTKTSF